jgi:hypothetical protein
MTEPNVGPDDTVNEPDAQPAVPQVGAAPRRSLFARLRSSILVMMAVYALGGVAVGYAYWRAAIYPKSASAAIDRLFAAVNLKDYKAIYDAVQFDASASAVSVDTLKTLGEARPNSLPRTKQYVIGAIRETKDGAMAEVDVRFEGGPPKAVKAHMPLKNTASGWKVNGAWLLGQIAERNVGL